MTMTMNMTMDRHGLLARAHLLLLAFAGLYVVFLGLLTVPYFQSHALFLHAIRWPLFADFDNPVKYGLPATRSLNVRIQTADNLNLGAWLVLPPSQADRDPYRSPPSSVDIENSISTRPTILFFHGNAATRAISFRARCVSQYASRLGANVLAIDYRGFGDSEGTPSEKGLIVDARAAWDWAIQYGARPENILLVGLSLGTSVVSGFGAELAREDVHPRGVVLLSPFSSLKALLTKYRIFGMIPILQPLEIVPPLQNYFANLAVASQFDTSKALPSIRAPILLAHSKDDSDIPHRHSQDLFNGFLEELLPPAPPVPASSEDMKAFDWDTFKAAHDRRRSRRSELVVKQEIPRFATVERVKRPNEFGEVIFVEALYGGHDKIGLQDSLIDFVDAVFF